MPIGQRTPGPIDLFASFNDGAGGYTNGFYLGTCIAAPESEGEKFKIEVMNDIGGRSVPFQLVQDGEKWFVMLAMNRFNYSLVSTIRALESGPTGSVTPAPLGSESSVARGTLVIGISDWRLIAINRYWGTTSAGQFIGGIAASDLPKGRMFYSCNLRKYKESTQGTRVLDIAMAIECQNLYYPTTKSFSCYTEDATKFPTFDAVV